MKHIWISCLLLMLSCKLTDSMGLIEDFFRYFDRDGKRSVNATGTGIDSEELKYPGPYIEPASKICDPNRRCMFDPCTNEWSEWSEWTPCSHICGKGTRARHRECLGEYQVCDGPNVDFQECFGKECQVTDYMFGSEEDSTL